MRIAETGPIWRRYRTSTRACSRRTWRCGLRIIFDEPKLPRVLLPGGVVGYHRNVFLREFWRYVEIKSGREGTANEMSATLADNWG
jgi:hypothetical protein